MRTEADALTKGLIKWRKLKAYGKPGKRVRVTEDEVDALCDHFCEPEQEGTSEAALFWSRAFTGPLGVYAVGKTGTHFMALRAESDQGEDDDGTD